MKTTRQDDFRKRKLSSSSMSMEGIAANQSDCQPRRIYAIGGGKGGTGKSFITATLGIILAKQGKRVLLIDLDLGASNLHTFLAIKKPAISLKQYLDKQVDEIDEIALPTFEKNLSIITSQGCSLEIANLYYAQKVKLLRAIRNLNYDFILLDLGSGTHFNTIDFFLISNEGILITTPEPVSVENMFRFIKSIYLRKMRLVIKDHGLSAILQEALNRFKNSEYSSPSDLLRALKRHDHDKGTDLENSIRDLDIMLILNQFKSKIDDSFGDHLAKVCNRHLYFIYQFIGNVTFDSRVGDATLENQIFIDKYRYTKTAAELQDIGKQIVENTCDATRPLSVAS